MRRRLQTSSVLIAVLFALVALGCASGPRVGIRKAFKGTQLQALAIARPGLGGSFGMSQAEQETLVARYELAVSQTLAHSGLRLYVAADLDRGFDDPDLSREFADATGAPALERRFEPERQTFVAPEVELVKSLHAAGRLPARHLLVAEIVYFTTAFCDSDPREHSPHARVEPPAKQYTPMDCVVSHFQAKIVDAESGTTVWHNRRLLEAHGVDPELPDRTIVNSVSDTLLGEQGIGPLLPPMGTSR